MKLLTKISLASAILGVAFLPAAVSANAANSTVVLAKHDGGGHHGGKAHHGNKGDHHGDKGRHHGVNVYIHGGHGYGHRGYYHGHRGYYGGHRVCRPCFICRSRHYSVKTCNFGTVNYYRAHGYSCYRYGGCRRW